MCTKQNCRPIYQYIFAYTYRLDTFATVIDGITNSDTTLV